MSTRGVSLDEYTSFARVSRFCKSNVCAINYEEPTPDWSQSLGNASLGGGNAAAPSSSAPPPPPRSRRESGTTSRPIVTGPAPGTRGAAIARNLKSATATQRFVIDRAAARAALEPSMGEELEEEEVGGQLILPPAPPAFPTVRRGEVLLPERSHDPSYYPGLVNDPEPEPEVTRKWPVWASYVAGGVGLFIAGLIARGVLSGPTTWSAVIDVTPPEAHVTIDGQTLSGAGSPRTRDGLIAGDHVLVVEQPGYVSQREVFSISGTDRRVVVNLDHEKKPEPVVEPSEPDAVAQPEPVAAAPAIEPLQDLSLLSKKELAKLKRREKIAERYRARKAAAADQDSAAEARAAAKEAKAAARAAAKEERASQRAAVSGEPTERAAKPASGATGLLKLNSIPWSEVYVDKKHVGHTPLLGLPVSTGNHTIEFKNPGGPQKKVKVQVHAGETVTKIENLGG